MITQLLFWKKHPFLLLSAIYLCGYLSCASNDNNNDKLAQQYINQYKTLAIQEMERMGVPASIKLAQGMLETNYGQSKLAQEGRNHFGIKCKNYWKGPTIYITDDAPNECFRKYINIEASYIDHSNFLMHHRNGHYSHLFDLDITDYKAWAAGLKKAGYATNPHYTKGLIRMIQRYHLYEFDEKQDVLVQAVPKDPYISNAYTKPTAPTTTRIKTITTASSTIVPSRVSKAYTKPSRNNQTIVKTYPSKTYPAKAVPPANSPGVSKSYIPSTPPKSTVTASNVKVFKAGKKNTNTTKQQPKKVTPIVPKPTPPATVVVAPLPPPPPSYPTISTTASSMPTVSMRPLNPSADTKPSQLQISDISINRCYAVFANQPLLPAFIANHYNLPLKKVYEYNDIQAGQKFNTGYPIYLQKKKRKAARGFHKHKVRAGETMLDIAQKYGIQLANLYRINKIPQNTQPRQGETISLRRKVRKIPKLIRS